MTGALLGMTLTPIVISVPHDQCANHSDGQGGLDGDDNAGEVH